MENPKELLGNKLKEMNKHITTEDRAAYRADFPMSKITLSIYLNGTVSDIEKGMKMVEFFQGRISARNEKIQELIK